MMAVRETHDLLLMARVQSDIANVFSAEVAASALRTLAALPPHRFADMLVAEGMSTRSRLDFQVISCVHLGVGQRLIFGSLCGVVTAWTGGAVRTNDTNADDSYEGASDLG